MKRLLSILVFFLTLGSLNLIAQEITQPKSQFFIENKGQWDNQVQYLARLGGLNLWITNSGVVYDYYNIERDENITQENGEPNPRAGEVKRMWGHVIKSEFLGTSGHFTPQAFDERDAYYNYFIGNDPEKWASFVPLYGSVQLNNIYDNIDVRYYYDQNSVRYDWTVRASGDPSNIRIKFEGQDGMRVNEKGELVFQTSVGEVTHARILAYQMENGNRTVIQCKFKEVGDGVVTFEVGSYNEGQDLIIDPFLLYSTYLGGTSTEYGYAIAADNLGNAYVTGYTSSSNFPTTVGAWDRVWNSTDIYVTKFNQQGSNLEYSTFLGGTSYEYGYSIAVDGAGCAYVTGYTGSSNFPTTVGAWDRVWNSTDVFVTKFNPQGSNLVYSTYLGGTSGEYGYGIAVDGAGSAYVTGYTYSSNFPTTPGCWDNTYNSYDVFVTKFNTAGSGLVYSTYLGGNSSDYGYDIAVDGSGSAYVTGYTYSGDFPTTQGAYDRSFNLGVDAFVTKFNTTGSNLAYSTYLGGNSSDYGRGIAVDELGTAIVGGYTYSMNFPTTDDALRRIYKNTDAFFSIFKPNGDILEYSTYLGGSMYDYASGMNPVAYGGSVGFITGYTNSTDFPTTEGCWDNTLSGYDVYVTAFDLAKPPKATFPGIAPDDLLFANELYNGETRQRLDEHGVPYDFYYKKPFIEFYEVQKPGALMKFEITGPLPENNSVYLALDANTGAEWIDISGLTYYEIQKATGLCSPGGNGDFMYERGGQFILTITLRQAGRPDKVYTFPFTVSWENDLSIYGITSPRTSGAPAYFQYPRNLDISLIVKYQNLGIKDVTRFKATLEIYDPDGNLFEVRTQYFDTANGYSTIKRGEIADINFGIFNTGRVGYWKIITKAELLNATDMDAYNNIYRRVGDEEYYFSIQWGFNGVASEIRFPKPTDQIIAHRPFRPVGFVKNEGINDLSDIVATFEYWKEPDGEHKTVTTTITEIPSAAGSNYAYATFPSIVIDEIGSYHAIFTINVPDEEYISDNTIEGDFTVIEGLSGVYTIGTKNQGSSRNYKTIEEAMNALYLRGMTRSVVFEFTDNSYDVFSPLQDRPAWDLTGAILGLGYDVATNTTRTLTFRPSEDKAATSSSVTINLHTANGKGILFGQSLMNMNPNAIINQNIEEELLAQYAENNGYITFDGGAEKSLRFILHSDNLQHGAVFYLGKGSHNITIQNCLIENGTDQLAAKHWLPRITYNVAEGFISQDDNIVTVDGQYGYSAGIVNRATHPMVQEEILAKLPLSPNYSNVIVGNEIKGFGIGIVSMGIGVGTDESGGFVAKYNHNNIIRDNVINRVDYAGIYVGYEDNTVVEYNKIYKVRGTTGEAYGILAGMPGMGNYYGSNNQNVRINSNEISDLTSATIAVGIRGIQTQLKLSGSTGELVLPSGADNLNIHSNAIWDIKTTSGNALRGGIYVATARESDASLDIPVVADYFIDNLNVSNNTVLISNDAYSNYGNAGIAVQNVKNSKLMNNAISNQDNDASANALCNSAVLYMGLFPGEGTLDINNNVYWVAQGASVARFIETDEKSEIVELGELNEYPTLAHWSLWTGMDQNSVDNYNILNDYVISGYDPQYIGIRSNPLPTGSVLNNRGIRLSEVGVDLKGNARGVQNQAYDIGAIEFNGTPYVSDLQPYGILMENTKREVAPSVYSDAFYYMMGRKTDFKARIYNGGANTQSQVPITITIEQENPDGTFTNYITEQTKVSIINPSTFTDVAFNLDDEVGVEFAPKTYYELNKEREAAGLALYTIPDRFKPMAANVTPIYRVSITTPLDQENNNNTKSYEFRYFVERSPIRLLTMSKSDKTELSASPSIDEIATKLNNENLDKAFNEMGWYIDYEGGRLDYDYLYIDGWMPKALNFNNYSSVVMSDPDYEANGENLTTYQMRALRSFLESGKSDVKKNLVIASQELARLNRSGENQVFFNEYFKLNNHYPSNPMGLNGNYDGNTVKGVSIAKNFEMKIQSTGLAGDDYPKPGLLRMVDPVANQTFIGFIYTRLEEGKNGENDTEPYPNSERIMSIATTTLQYNAVYLGADWRHFEKPGQMLRAVSDFIESNGGNLVPIELLSFNAEQAGNRVDLNWATASETNSLKFEIEKADITNTTLADYVSMKEVPAAGLSIDTKKYGPVSDYDVVNGHTYSYRLKMVDKDGKFAYSNVEKVKITGQAGGMDITEILPNPATEQAKFELIMEDGASIDLALYDMSGRRVETIFAGMKSSGRYPINIDCKNYANGTYSLVLTSGDVVLTKTFQISK